MTREQAMALVHRARRFCYADADLPPAGRDLLLELADALQAMAETHQGVRPRSGMVEL